MCILIRERYCSLVSSRFRWSTTIPMHAEILRKIVSPHIHSNTWHVLGYTSTYMVLVRFSIVFYYFQFWGCNKYYDSRTRSENHKNRGGHTDDYTPSVLSRKCNYRQYVHRLDTCITFFTTILTWKITLITYTIFSNQVFEALSVARFSGFGHLRVALLPFANAIP